MRSFLSSSGTGAESSGKVVGQTSAKHQGGSTRNQGLHVCWRPAGGGGPQTCSNQGHQCTSFLLRCHKPHGFLPFSMKNVQFESLKLV